MTGYPVPQPNGPEGARQSRDSIRLIAFHLTQYHPIPENDEWWGRGFTEWTNVTKSRPLFEGHYQPQLPADLGFYDLRLKEARHAQIRLAQDYGIDGFCYHYYWFSGKRLLNRPLDEMLADPSADMPFCLSWANENWTRRWDAAEREVLIEQLYRPEDDQAFISDVLPFLQDPRYIKVRGAPLLIVYRPQQIPDPKKTIQSWRAYCHQVGLGQIHVAAALTHGNKDYLKYGCDSGVEFPPHNTAARDTAETLPFYGPFHGQVIRYEDIAEEYLERDYKDGVVFRTVFPAWDNTARVGSRSLIVSNSSPDNYEHWLSSVLDGAADRSDVSGDIVFVNAWNEWAEGCHLEPDSRDKLGYLEATLRAKRGLTRSKGFASYAGPRLAKTEQRSLRRDLGSLLAYHAASARRSLFASIRARPWLKKLFRPAYIFARNMRRER